MRSAVKKYREFHDLDPKYYQKFPASVKIPETAAMCGYMDKIYYFSTKWNDPAHYVHDHHDGVKCCIPGGDGRAVKIPKWIREQEVLVQLGDCEGFTYKSPNGLMEAKVKSPKPKLYCTPNGKALLVISRKVEAIIWGGDMYVESKGIVG